MDEEEIKAMNAAIRDLDEEYRESLIPNYLIDAEEDYPSDQEDFPEA